MVATAMIPVLLVAIMVEFLLSFHALASTLTKVSDEVKPIAEVITPGNSGIGFFSGHTNTDLSSCNLSIGAKTHEVSIRVIVRLISPENPYIVIDFWLERQNNKGIATTQKRGFADVFRYALIQSQAFSEPVTYGELIIGSYSTTHDFQPIDGEFRYTIQAQANADNSSILRRILLEKETFTVRFKHEGCERIYTFVINPVASRSLDIYQDALKKCLQNFEVR